MDIRHQTQSTGFSPFRKSAPSYANVTTDLGPSYDPPITRRLLEALLGVSTPTVVKYEQEGSLTPVRMRFGSSVEVVTYNSTEVRALLNKRGNPLVRHETQVISVFSIKGGVGKTAFTQHIASLLSLYGRTLVIDIDAQADCTAVFGINETPATIADADDEAEPTVAELLDWKLASGDPSPYRRLQLSDVVKTLSPTLQLIPSELDLGEINYSLNRLGVAPKELPDGSFAPGELYILKDLIDSLRPQFDFILIDCPPNIETFNVAALKASNRILVPVGLEAKCVRTMRRNQRFLERLQSHDSSFSWDKILIVANMFRNEPIKTKALAKLEDLYQDNQDIQISQAVFPYSAVIDRCSANRQPIHAVASGVGKVNRSVTEAAKKLSDGFWIVMHEILDAPLDRLLFKSPDQPEVL